MTIRLQHDYLFASCKGDNSKMVIVVDKTYETGCPWVYMGCFLYKESYFLGHWNRVIDIVPVYSDVPLNTNQHFKLVLNTPFSKSVCRRYVLKHK